MTIVLACSRLWRRDLAERVAKLTGRRCELITERAELNVQRLSELNPEWVFLPHWSHLVPREVHERWPCVIFHMTDLPFGRGGSPLQNLIARGIYETKIRDRSTSRRHSRCTAARRRSSCARAM